MISKKFDIVISFVAVKKIWQVMVIFLFCQLFVLACNKKSESESNPPVVVSNNQTFILNISVNKKNVNKLKEIVQKDLFPILISNLDIRSLKVFDSPPDGPNNKFFILIEIKKANEKGIVLNNKGQVVNIDFSHFISPDVRNSPAFANLVSLKDLINEYELKVYKLNEDLLINREMLGSVKAE